MLKKTVMISFLTLVSRILGVVRDAIIAMLFGTSAQSDAFFIAFRPFDLVRKLFSEGILGISFIPVFSKTLEKEGKSAAIGVLFSFFCFLSLAAVVIMVAGLVFAPFIIKIIAPGFSGFSYQHDLTIVLFKIMLPYLALILMSGLSMGVLNSLGNFGTPAMAPVIFNCCVISFALCMASWFEIPVTALAVGVTIGGILQLAIQIPAMMQMKILKPVQFKLFHPKSMQILKVMIPSMIGAASYQVNIMVASFYASTLDQGSVSYLYYADRLVQFPLALFAVSVATVFLPDFSRKAARGNAEDAGDLFTNGVCMVLFVTIPAMAGLMALDHHIVSVLFARGAFGELATDQTAQCLFVLVTGLWAYTAIRLFVTLYFALSSIRIPFYSGLLAIGLNLLLCPVLIHWFGISGVASSVSVSAIAGALFLFARIPSVFHVNRVKILVCACRSLFFSVIMFFLVRLAADHIVGCTQGLLSQSAALAGCVCLGVIFYMGINYAVSSPESKLIAKGIRRQQ